ncbi:MAG TPA: PAS domain S-box protein [Verrucomicrobiae bacterium]|nr:PAS domain S-box protein [Verrucomicrobiae bacterium]
MRLQDLPIRRRIMAAIMLTSMTVVFLTVAAFMIYDLTTLRRTMARDFTTLARVLADNSSAALAFQNDIDARKVLASVTAEPQIVAAALYDADGSLFVFHPPELDTASLPKNPTPIPYQFSRHDVVLVQPVMEATARYGTLYLKADLRMFYSRLKLYAVLSIIILASAVIVAFALSNRLQRHVSEPILELAGAAQRVSKLADYSVRVPLSSAGEIGLLTSAFNQMLTRIQEQTVAIQESENRLRIALEASRTGTWDWDIAVSRVRWDERNAALFGLKPSEFRGTYEHFEALIEEGTRETVKRAVKHALEQKTDFEVEFPIVLPNGTRRQMLARGRAFYDGNGKAVHMSGVTQDVTERRRSEVASRWFSAIVESTDDAIVGKDMHGIVTSWNRGAERIYGYTADEMIGKQMEILSVPEDAGFEERLLDQVRRGETRQYEVDRVCKDGKRITVALTSSPVRSNNGEVIGVSSISRDITARKLAERELEESRARLSGIIGSAMDAIISVDSNQTITLFNAAAERMFRVDAIDAVGKPLDMFIPERFRRAHRGHVQEFSKTGSTARAMGHLRPLAGLRANGEEFPIEASISHIEIGQQQIFTVILRDITERMNAEQSLERQARVLREQAQMLDLANVLARDLDDRVILWNTGMEKMYGWLRTETLGQVAHQILKAGFPAPLEEIKAILYREGHWEGEVVHTRKDGQLLYVNSHWVLHTDPQGQPIAVLEVNTDITERKHAEQEILRMNAELERRVQERTTELVAANHELEAFTYSVAHDLRAPLRHIDAFTKIIFDDFADEIPEEARHYLENIRKGSQNMNQLVDDLLNLARIGRQEPRRETTQLNVLVDDIISDLRRETDRRNVEWRVSPLPTVECDPGLIKQVLVNILSNAVKYTRPRQQAVIEVGQFEENGETVIFIRDNGVGFNMKYIDKLFGVFQRLHRSDEFEGTGVGLATVERIIRKHGGRIWAEAQPDKGATFYFTLGNRANAAAA